MFLRFAQGSTSCIVPAQILSLGQLPAQEYHSFGPEVLLAPLVAKKITSGNSDCLTANEGTAFLVMMSAEFGI